MGKTRAEYQKEYRERKKKTDRTYLEKERRRAKSYRVPIDALNRRKQEVIRERNRQYVRKFRAKIKLQNELNEESNGHEVQPEPSTSRSNEDQPEQLPTVSSSSDSTNQKKVPTMVVKMNFEPKKKQPLKRSKALRSASYKMKNIKSELKKVTREKEKLRKRNSRLIKRYEPTQVTQKNMSTPSKNKKTNVSPNKTQCSTPKSKTKLELKRAGISPTKVPKQIKKKLEMANAMIEEVKEANKFNETQKSKRVLMNIVSGKVMNKYKCIRTLSRETGISRRSLQKAKTKKVVFKPRNRQTDNKEKLKHAVTAFLERDDNSVCMPGKKDYKKTEGAKKQTRVLNDYMSNLYEKFKSENPRLKISKSVFCRLRPSNILLTKLITRNTCLCSKHQNMAMKLKCLRQIGIDVSSNPETASKNVSRNEMSDLLKDGLKADDKVEFEEWKRVDVEGKKKMKIIKVSMNKIEFEEYLNKQYDDFLNHVERVKDQYSAIKELKENLPDNEVVVHMDFAENFTCSNADEIQSAYWNSTAVTLHPVVVYHRAGQDLEHKSFIYVSDVTNHNSAAVYTILKKLVPELKSLFPDMTMVHYWTDSPSSQYRNKYMFDVVLHHSELFGMNARWNYFEAGHGKGPCDGIGGTAKRQAGEACRQGKVIIQDAQDFYSWASSQKKSIEYVFYTTDEYETAAAELNGKTLKPIRGTMKLHAVFPKEGKLYTGTVSCYCRECLTGKPCNKWDINTSTDVRDEPVEHRDKRKAQETDDFPIDEVSQNKKMKQTDKKMKENAALIELPKVNSFILVEYDEMIYPAKVLEIDEDEGDARVSFMEASKGKGALALFKWPAKPDELWVDLEQVVHSIQDPVPCGKTKRQFKLHDGDYIFLKNK